MTEYAGSQVPVGGEKVIEFFTKKNGQAIEPNALEVEWRKDAAVQETDTLAGGGVYRPTGSTSSNDPGHFKAKRLIPTDAALGTGYAAYGRWKENAGDAFTGWVLIETFEVVASALSLSLGQPLLCTVTDVRDRAVTIKGAGALPVGATDTRILGIVTIAHNSVVARFGKAAMTELTEQQKVVGKGACILLSVADLLVSLYPASESVARIASEYRKRAWEDVDRTSNPPTPASGKKRPKFKVV